MLDRVRRQLEGIGISGTGNPMWVAVSGGVDSMVLLHALHALGHPCQVAHVDHGLRGVESDADRELVLRFADDLGLSVQVHRVNVAEHAHAHGSSIQMAARELRLAWFHELVTQGPDVLALAHHRDDAVETLFIQLLRGMGLHGWKGIAPRTGPFIRPLMGMGRDSVLAYANDHSVPFREDASNLDPKYLRNRVRHELLPLLEDIRPGARRVLARDSMLLAELLTAGLRDLQTRIEGVAQDPGGSVRIPFHRVLDGGTPYLMLHLLLDGQGVHPDRMDDILLAIQRRSTGAVFPLGDRRVLVDRDELVIGPVAAPVSWTINSPDHVPAGCPLIFLTGDRASHGPAQASNMACFDASALKFPIELRTWRPGDRMQPAGMQGTRLVSDLLIDAKVPRDRKERTMVLLSEGRIAWLCGHRLAEGYSAGIGDVPVLVALLPDVP